jgi:ribonuclease MRP protein subunit RMP1
MASTNNTDVASLQQALDLLGPALGILDSFNHRHKNQHRLSKWWAQFDMLRRAIRKLIVDLQACLDSHAKRASSRSGGTKKKQKAAVQKQQDDALQRSLDARARHVHSQLMPRAFLYVHYHPYWGNSR